MRECLLGTGGGIATNALHEDRTRVMQMLRRQGGIQCDIKVGGELRFRALAASRAKSLSSDSAAARIAVKRSRRSRPHLEPEKKTALREGQQRGYQGRPFGEAASIQRRKQGAIAPRSFPYETRGGTDHCATDL